MIHEKRPGTPSPEAPSEYGPLLKAAAIASQAAVKGIMAELASNKMKQKVAEGFFLPDGAILPGADFSSVNLSGMETRGAFLRGARFDGAILEGARVYNASLMDAHFPSVQARTVRFESCSLERAVFEDADVRGGTFSSSILVNAKFRRARLEGANFADSVWTGIDLKEAIFDDHVVLPNGIKLGAFIRECLPSILAAGGADPGTVFRASEWSSTMPDRILYLAFGERDLSDPMDDRFSNHPDCYQFNVPVRVGSDVVLFLKLLRAGAIPFSKVKDFAK